MGQFGFVTSILFGIVIAPNGIAFTAGSNCTVAGHLSNWFRELQEPLVFTISTLFMVLI
jgi:hypothetical protein